MFAPDWCPDPPPIPLNHIDVTRITKTDLENQDEKSIEDVWDGGIGDVRKLREWWVGETVFHRFLREPKGYRVVQGRLTRIQKTTRPPSIWPEVWNAMSRKQRDIAITNWKKCGQIDASRVRRGLDPADGADAARGALGRRLGLCDPHLAQGCWVDEGQM